MSKTAGSKRNVLRGAFSALSAVMAAALSGPAPAQSGTWPVKPIVIVVPQTPGSAGDIYSRLYGQKVTENTGWRILVENRPGAGSTLGTNLVARAVPDGHTLLNTSASLTANPLIYKDAPEPLKVFQAVTLLSRAPSMLLVRADFPARTFQEYVAYARANPGKINFGTSGYGGTTHLGGVWLHALVDVRVTYVPYKGSGDLVTAMMAGEIHAILGAMTVNLPLVNEGRARSLGISTPERNPVVPDMPPLTEVGAKGFEYDAWTGIVAPAAVPMPVITRLNAEFVKAGAHPDVIKRLAPSGQRAGGSSIEEFRRILASETERWRSIARDANLKLQPE